MQQKYSGDAIGALRDIVPTSKCEHQSITLWSSPEALATYVASVDRAKTNKCHVDVWSESKYRDTFTGVQSMEEAITLCRDGWSEGAERVARMRDKISVSHPTERRPRDYAVSGAFPDVQRYIAGNPAHMRRLGSTQSQRRPVITLLCDTTFAGFVSSENITNRAAVVAAVVDMIESAGFACHVVSLFASLNGDHQHTCAVTVKESDQPVDTARLAFALGHAAMFRRLMWVPMSMQRRDAPMGRGRGQPTKLPASTENNVYYIGPDGVFDSEESAETTGLDNVLTSLRSQGCPAFA